MDKNTLSNYGWIVIAVLVLSVMIALATPFGEYIKAGVESTTAGLFDTSEKALNVVGMSAKTDETEKATASGSYISVNDVASKQHNLKVNLSSDIVTDFSNVTVTKTGKNLFDIQSLYVNGNCDNFIIDGNSFEFTKVNHTSSGCYAALTNLYLPAGNYVLSGNTSPSAFIIIENMNTKEQIRSQHTAEINESVSITKSGMYKIYCFMAAAEIGTTQRFSNIQLEMGSLKTDYEAYTKQSVKANADGSVFGLTSISPNMTIIADSDDVEITCEYQKKN